MKKHLQQKVEMDLLEVDRKYFGLKDDDEWVVVDDDE